MAVATALAPLLLLHRWLAAPTGSALVILQHASYALSAGPLRFKPPSKPHSILSLYGACNAPVAGLLVQRVWRRALWLCQPACAPVRQRCSAGWPPAALMSAQAAARSSAAGAQQPSQKLCAVMTGQPCSWRSSSRETSQLQWNVPAKGASGEPVACSVSPPSAYSCAWCSLLD